MTNDASLDLLLARAQRKQREFDDAIWELQGALEFQIEDTSDLQDMTIADLREIYGEVE